MSKDKVKAEIEKHKNAIRKILFQHLEVQDTVSEIVGYILKVKKATRNDIFDDIEKMLK